MSQKSKKTWIISGVIALVLGCVGTYDALNNKIILRIDDNKQHISTFSKTVQDLLIEKNIKLEDNDKVLPDLNSKLKDDMQITVKRAFKVNLILDGAKKEVITTESNIKNLLKQEKINLSSLDKVIPDLDYKLKPNDSVTIVRVQEKLITEKQQIPFTIQTVYDENLEIGKIEKVQQGTYGEKEATYKLILNDGKEVTKNLVAEKIVMEPRNEVIKKGTKNFIVTSRGEVRRFRKSLQMVASAYTAGYESTGKSPGDAGYGKTAMGTTVRSGVVAVDPRVIPLGTKLYIESMDMIAIAEDTGGAIKGNKIDIYISELSKARKFGRRTIKVYVLE